MPNEDRLDQLREEAWTKGAVSGRGVDISGGPIPVRAGYYGEPVVRPPVWTWEIPIYFFVGGLAGMSAAIAAAAILFYQTEIARSAMIASAAGAILSPILLIMDLGRPRMFINMLRVFKPQSAMSMGAWILTFFSMLVFPGLLAIELEHFQVLTGAAASLLHVLGILFTCGSAILGVLLATYTGVLIGATVVPVWFLHRVLLPIHFGIAGLGSAAALLELIGHRTSALSAIGFCAAVAEIGLAIWLALNRHGAADAAAHHGASGWLIRVAEFLTGPVPLVCRFVGFVPVAAISFIAGSLLSRFGWMHAGRVSGADPLAVFASQAASD